MILAEAGPKSEIDHLDGSPPCQGFSMSGNRDLTIGPGSDQGCTTWRSDRTRVKIHFVPDGHDTNRLSSNTMESQNGKTCGDFGVSVFRPDKNSTDVEIYIRKVRFSETGSVGDTTLRFITGSEYISSNAVKRSLNCSGEYLQGKTFRDS